MNGEAAPTNEDLRLHLVRIEAKQDSITLILSDMKIDQTDHEKRIRTIEDVHTKIDPLEASKKLDGVIDYQKRQSTLIKVLAAVWGFVVVLISYLADHLLAKVIR